MHLLIGTPPQQNVQKYVKNIKNKYFTTFGGVQQNNTKFSFPSDNSVIRTDKYYVGQRRMGESQIIKDNFVFGISETKEAFNQKVQGEDGLRNRDAKQLADKRCDFALTFENGVRLFIEM